MNDDDVMDFPMSRRRFLAVAGGGYGSLALAACGKSQQGTAVLSDNPAVEAAERRRRRPGAAVREVDLVAAPMTLDLAGRPAATWAYGGAVPGREIRVKAGEVLRARITNQLPETTSIHWHGVALRNDMDGVPGLTQMPIESGSTFTYEFTAPDPGTFWFHPHSGLQLDRGLYSPLIVEDPAEPGRYDRELMVVLDDWVSGIGEAPEAILDNLRRNGMGAMDNGAMGGMAMARSALLGGDAGDVTYPLYLMNGRPPQDPPVFEARPGERLRIRLLNAGADTAFRVALGGHRLTVTHTDGFPVEPVIGDTVLMGMGERYDVMVTVAGEGSFPLVALAEGKQAQALGIVRTGPGASVPPDVRPAELDGQLLDSRQMRSTEAVALRARRPDRTYPLRLEGPGGSGRYRWTINGRAGTDHARLREQTSPLDVRQGERVRLVFENRSSMFHPMHLHGHTFQVVGAGTTAGPRKDTIIVRPRERLAVDFDADNPGPWLMHCHNIYHQEAGMMALLSYVT